MNILFLADIVPYPPNTGIKIRTFNIIKQLHNKGENSIYLFCFNHKLLIPDDQELQRYRSELKKYCATVNVYSIPSDKSKFSYYWCLMKNLFQSEPYRTVRYFSRSCWVDIEKCLQQTSIDLVHLDKTEFCNYLPLFRGIVTACTNHNVESQLMKRRSNYETSIFRKYFAYRQFEKEQAYEAEYLNRVDGYITCTRLDQQHFEKHLGVQNRYAIIDNGVDFERYASHIEESPEDYILIIGAQNKPSLANYDATMFFIQDIWPKIQVHNSSIRLKIVGRDPDQSIIALGEQANIEVVGWVEDERPYISKAKMLVVPLRVGGGSRLKIVTALAMSKAIVSTSIGAEGILYENDKNMAVCDDPDEFANSVVNLFQNNAQRKTLERGALDLAKKCYDWNIIGEKQRRFYQELLGQEKH